MISTEDGVGVGVRVGVGRGVVVAGVVEGLAVPLVDADDGEAAASVKRRSRRSNTPVTIVIAAARANRAVTERRDFNHRGIRQMMPEWWRGVRGPSLVDR